MPQRLRAAGTIRGRKSSDQTRRVSFLPQGSPPNGYRFALNFQKLDIQGPFGPPLITSFTTDPATLVLGIDRVGTLTRCRVTENGMICLDDHGGDGTPDDLDELERVRIESRRRR